MGIHIEDAIRFVIKDDRELVSKFLKFQSDNEIWNYKGSSAGMGNYYCYFPAEYKDKIKKFIDDNKGK